MKTKKARIHEVAALAGVSVGSASRVLNGVPNVSIDIRQRVEQAMEKLGYQPKYAARVLRLNCSMTLGCIFSDVTNPLYARAFRALEDSFWDEGYLLLLANGLGDPDREIELLKTFQSRGLDGIIYAPSDELHPGVAATLKSLSVPVVLYDRELQEGVDAVLFDHENGILQVCARLFEYGHRRIALSLWDSDSRPVRLRMEGYRAAYRAHGLECPELILKQPTATSSVYDELLGLLQTSNPPTALIAQGTQILATALHAIESTGRRIPDDFSVVSIGDSDLTTGHVPAITTMRANTGVVADHVKSLLLNRLAHPGATAERRFVAYELVSRASWGPPPTLELNSSTNTLS